MQGLTFKFLLIGNGAVGKTSLVRRLCRDTFDADMEMTIGVEFLTKNMTVNDVDVRLQIWDTAGQERYRSVGKAYYRNSLGVLVVFSLADHESFEALGMWFKEARQYCHPKAKILLVGNKCDLVKERCVTTAEAEAFAKSHRAQYIEASAKENTNVHEAFLTVAQDVYRAVACHEIVVNMPVCQDISAAQTEPMQNKRKCC